MKPAAPKSCSHDRPYGAEQNPRRRQPLLSRREGIDACNYSLASAGDGLLDIGLDLVAVGEAHDLLL